MMRYTLVAVLLVAATARAQDMPLSQVLIPGEGWKAVDNRELARTFRVDAVAADADGNPIVARMTDDEASLWTLTKDGYKQFAKKATVAEMCWNPDGDLLTIEEGNELNRRVPNAKAKKIATGPVHFAISPKGDIYYLAYSSKTLDDMGIFRLGHDKPIVRGLPVASCLTFWRDGGTLVVGDPVGDKLSTYRVNKDGSLDAKEGYYTLRTRGREPSGVKALTLDTDGRLYAATALGVQVFDPTGRMCGVILPPARKPVTAMTFAGPGRDHLYVVCDGKLYVRKTKVKGFVATSKKP